MTERIFDGEDFVEAKDCAFCGKPFPEYQRGNLCQDCRWQGMVECAKCGSIYDECNLDQCPECGDERRITDAWV